jgi:hypothetical protein
MLKSKWRTPLRTSSSKHVHWGRMVVTHQLTRGAVSLEQVKLREMLHKGRKDKKGPEAEEKQTTPDVYRTAVCCQVGREPNYLHPWFPRDTR